MVYANAYYRGVRPAKVVNGPMVDLLTLESVYDPLQQRVLHPGKLELALWGTSGQLTNDPGNRTLVTSFTMVLVLVDRDGHRLPMNDYPRLSGGSRLLIRRIVGYRKPVENPAISKEIALAMAVLPKWRMYRAIYPEASFELEAVSDTQPSRVARFDIRLDAKAKATACFARVANK
jgi:hypothetical protein